MPFSDFYRGKRVVLTGHTGFKGAWLAHWLLELGAEVTGISLEPPTEPALFNQLGLAGRLRHHILDIREGKKLAALICGSRPDVLFHLAAQAIVRTSYQEPVETFETNLLGTLHVLEGLRALKGKCAAVIVTSDKCYENLGLNRGYAEDDRLGGRDPYSASKACAEIALAAWRSSFFEQASGVQITLASGRAGNVIGGGDWALDRLLPDCVRALEAGQPILVRNRLFTRPWQHVLEALGGYLLLGEKLSHAASSGEIQSAFNFGPPPESNRTVEDLVGEVLRHWPGSWQDAARPDDPHEAKLLYVQADKARRLLGWQAVWSFEKTIEKTVSWYRFAASHAEQNVAEFTSAQISEYLKDAHASGQGWAA